jgi:hypothetical protein
MAEPVSFLVEYRCFAFRREVSCLSPYRRFGKDFDNSRTNMNEPESEVADAREFADAVLGFSDVDCPPAFVLDVGLIDGRGWAVVEANECWASGIYHCDPVKVLDVLKASCVPNEPWTTVHERWDFAAHYAAAAPK